MRKIYVLILAFITICFMSAGSFAFLTNKATNENNTVSTGAFPKFRVKLYSSSGPVFKETLSGHQNQQSLSYPLWLTDASKYIIKDLTGQVLEVPAPRDQYETYENIANNSKNISRKNTMVSANFYSWKGAFIDKHGDKWDEPEDKKEHGTTMHHIVVIENSKRYGQESPKIKLSDLKLDNITVSISQYDVFKGSKGEYNVQRQPEAFSLSNPQNSTRIRTFDLIDGKYVRSFKSKDGKITYGNQSNNGDLPADEADMILFDAGGEGYYAEPGDKDQLTEQQVLDQLYDRLCGNQPYADLNNDKYDIHYQNSTPMYNTVQEMLKKDDLKCSLNRSVCNVKLIKDGKIISEEINSIYFGN